MSVKLPKRATRSWKDFVLDKRDRALRIMCRDFGRTASVLAFRKVHCQIAQTGQYPAWSDYHGIYVNKTTAPEMKVRKDYATVTGLLDHELAHIIFTPSIPQMHTVCRHYDGHESYLASTLQGDKEPAFNSAWNLLEDQRIETLLIEEYPTMRAYLQLCFVEYIWLNKSQMDTMFLFTRGRRYLPRKMRGYARRSYKDQTQVADIVRLIDEYRLLDLGNGRDLARAFHIVNEFKKYIDDPGAMPTICACSHGGGSSGDADEQASQRVVIAVREKAAEEKGDDKGEPGDGEGDANSGEGGDGTGHGTDPNSIADEARAEAQADPDLQREMKQVADVIRNDDQLDATSARQLAWDPNPPHDAGSLVRKTVNAMRKIEEDADPYWNTHQSSGRLNIKRAMRADFGQDDLYDVWDEGREVGTDMEMYLALDVSGSMQHLMDELSLAAWVIKRATDTLRITCTVAAYASTHKIIYGPKEKAGLNKYPRLGGQGGNTFPAPTLVEGHRVLVTSRKKKRLLLILTDGSWSNHIPPAIRGMTGFTTNDELIADLNARRITTALVFLGNGIDSHQCATFRTIPTMHSFPEFVREQLVKELRK